MIRLIDGNGITVAAYEYDPYGKIISASGSMATINPLRYRGYYYDDETGLYYLQSRYYDPQTGRFISPDSYASTGQGILGNNMFAYCNNNPINFSDSCGNMPYYANDPAGEVGRILGQWIYGIVEEDKKERELIKSGEVTYVSNGTGAGARINNSHRIRLPWIMYEFVATNRSDDITGTTSGFVYEWVFHNIAYDIGKSFKQENIKNAAESVDVGKTIYSDRRKGFNITAVMSLGMQLTYTLLSPLTAAYDLALETGRWDFVYPRE